MAQNHDQELLDATDEAFNYTSKADEAISTKTRQVEQQGLGSGDSIANVQDEASKYYVYRYDTEDHIASRFHILVNQPLEHLNTDIGNAYAVEDKRHNDAESKYAFIFHNHCTLRLPLINILVTQHNIKNFIHPIEIGITKFSHTKTTNIAIIINKPPAKFTTLAKYIRVNRDKITDNVLIEKIIMPITTLIRTIHDLGYAHCGLKIDNVYIDDELNIIVGECVCNLPGYTQPLIYEPFERMLCNDIARGEGDMQTDYYALGILCLQVIQPKLLSYNTPDDKLCVMRLDKGSYAAILAESPIIMHNCTELIQGLTADHKHERWSYRQISDWIKGRKLTISANANFDNPVRSVLFNDTTHHNTRSLSYDIANAWDAAIRFITEPNFTKWVEYNISSPALRDSILNNIKLLQGGKGILGISKDEFLMRMTLSLNPYGPLVMHDIRTTILGVAPALAYHCHHENLKQIHHLYQVIIHLPTDILSYNFYSHNTKKINGEIMKKIIDLQLIISKKELGFGIERALYDLNPGLSCQSSELLQYCITNITDLLLIMEKHIEQHPDAVIMDRHIAAFIASKLKITKAFTIQTFYKSHDIFVQNKPIIALVILCTALKKTNITSLPHLTNAMIRYMASFTNLFSGSSIRADLNNKLEAIKDTGDLNSLINILSDPQFFRLDTSGFRIAKKEYGLLEKLIELSNNKKRLYDVGYTHGLRISVIMSYMLCFLIVLIMIIDYIN